MKMQNISDGRAVKILEWAFFNLSEIDPGDLTRFETQLLERISDFKSQYKKKYLGEDVLDHDY